MYNNDTLNWLLLFITIVVIVIGHFITATLL